ncbi:Protein kinase-like domain [Phytophthora cactorum]|nr:Protein kinase-like domain [Phytophthora cactorum]
MSKRVDDPISRVIGETPEVQASDDTSWIGTKLDMPLKPFSVGKLLRAARHRRHRHARKGASGSTQALEPLLHPQVGQEEGCDLLGSLATSSHVHFLLEYVPGGELFHRLHAVGRLSNDEAKFYATELVVFIEACHTNGFMYRDLKPENILLDAGGHLKVVDFGFAKRLRSPSDRTSSSVGTPEYLAPSSSRQNLLAPVHAKHVEDLLRSMLQCDPSKRLSEVDTIKQHAWFENVDWDAVPLRQVTAPFVPTLACAGDTTNFDDYPSSSEETPPLDNDASRQEFLNF